MRAGRFVRQLEGYRAFIPSPLPPKPPLTMDAELLGLLSKADRALGRLDGVTSVLPNPNLFLAMYVRHEAVLSSQIEGTQSTLEDVLQFELDEKGQERPTDVNEIVNYVNAMNHGLERLTQLPLSKRLIGEIHAKLLHGVRGGGQTPGEFRRSQNWIGPEGCNLRTATFVPPPVHEMHKALDDLENFLHDRASLPVLIHCALAHAQFETIHPFIDGNGRVGRLLIAFLLCEREILQRPLLYLSYYLKAHRTEYYDRLMAVRRKGDWEGWVKFFLQGVFEVSQSATTTARKILELREEHRQVVENPRLLDHLFEQPILSVSMVQDFLGCSYPKASKLVDQYTEKGLLREITGNQRNRRFRYDTFMKLFDAPEFVAGQNNEAVETTLTEDEK
ncbi:MAG: Fic family protein [Isosphaeraceae bacterium]